MNPRCGERSEHVSLPTGKKSHTMFGALDENDNLYLTVRCSF